MQDSSLVNILVVDDNKANLKVLEATLSGCGWNILTALSGEEALKIVLSTSLALILLDAHMPVMDGYETARVLNSSEKTREIPIILVSASLSEDIRPPDGFDAGIVDYITKPIIPELVTKKVMVFVRLYQALETVKENSKLIDELRAQIAALKKN